MCTGRGPPPQKHAVFKGTFPTGFAKIPAGAVASPRYLERFWDRNGVSTVFSPPCPLGRGGDVPPSPLGAWNCVWLSKDMCNVGTN